jgi:type IV pilus assembly protein PilN
MIRINLLPVKAAQRRASGLRQMLIAGIVALLGFTATVAFHIYVTQQLAIQKRKITELQAQIAQLKTEVGDYDLVKAQREDLLRQKNAIKKLQSARSGPTYLMRELSDILTKGKGPTFNKEQYEELLRRDPNAGFNPNWEPKRAWLISYEEKEKAVKIHGGAKSDEDVAEFLKRLKLSAFFSDVYWQQTQPQVDTKMNNVSYVTFDVAARVNY